MPQRQSKTLTEMTRAAKNYGVGRWIDRSGVRQIVRLRMKQADQYQPGAIYQFDEACMIHTVESLTKINIYHSSENVKFQRCSPCRIAKQGVWPIWSMFWKSCCRSLNQLKWSKADRVTSWNISITPYSALWLGEWSGRSLAHLHCSSAYF